MKRLRINRTVLSVAIATTGILASACTASSADHSARFTVPVLAYEGGIRPAGEHLTLEALSTAGGQACPFVDTGEEVGLLVSPPGSYAHSSPMALVIGGTTITVGQRFQVVRTERLDAGFECGGQHWPTAFWLKDETVSLLPATSLGGTRIS